MRAAIFEWLAQQAFADEQEAKFTVALQAPVKGSVKLRLVETFVIHVTQANHRAFVARRHL
mgnify:CR=1 FL=1